MITVAQRWRTGRDSYRPANETINTALYDVAPLPRDTEAKQFILEHHYSGSYPSARWRYGLYRQGSLVNAHKPPTGQHGWLG